MSFLTDYFKQEEKNVISLKEEREKREKLMEQCKYIQKQERISRQQYATKEYEKLQKQINSLAGIPASALPSPKPYPGGGGAAASGGGMHSHSIGGGGFQQGSYHAVYSDSHVRSSVDVGSLIKEAVEEAAKEFKLTVDTMQEQIDELWEYIRELEDE